MNLALWRMNIRSLKMRPTRAFLTLLSIIIGTAAVVAVSMATQTARLAQEATFAVVSGRADLEVSGEGGTGFPAEIASKIQDLPEVDVAVPTLHRFCVLFADDRRARTQALGIDPQRDTLVREYAISEGRAVERGYEVMLDASFARSMNIKVGDVVKLLTRSLGEWQVVGLVRPQGGSAIAQGGTLYMPLETAQYVFRTRDQIDSVEIILKPDGELEASKNAIESLLSPGITLREPATSSQLADQATVTTEQGLRLATAFALLIAVFIIYNTFTMVVGERRRHLGILRAIGATRRQVTWFVLRESVLMGVVGTIIGSIVGVFGARLLNEVTAQVLQLEMPSPQLSIWPFLIAAGFGIGVSWLGAYVPARRAGRVPPMEAMRLVSQGDTEASIRWVAWLGVFAFLTGSVILIASMYNVVPVDWSVAASVILLLGVVGMLPMLLHPLGDLVVWAIAPVIGIEARLAEKQLLRHRDRTALTTGVLFIAISTGVGLASAIIDNVRDVQNWYDKAIVGDFFVRASMPDLSSGRSADLPDGLLEDLQQIPGIQELDSLRFVGTRSERNSVIVVIRDFVSPDQNYFDLVDGDEQEVLDGLKEGKVVIGTVLAERVKLGRGDTIPIETPDGPRSLDIVGTANDYIGGGLTIYMERSIAEDLLKVEGYDAYIVKSEPGRIKQVEAELEKLCDSQGLLLQSYADLVGIIQKMSDGIVASLWTLLGLGAAIASFGLVNTLSMNVLEQTREIGMLRVVAMTRSQVRKMVFSQALLMGLIGLLPGTAMGIFVAFLINLSTLTATGHPIPFTFRPLLAIAAFFGGMVIVIISSWIPAERAARMPISEAMQYE